MRAWRSKLYIPQATLDKVDKDMRDARGVDTGSLLWPACDVCSTRLAVRFSVEEYGVADRGITPGGEHYTDVRARCHGEEQVIRIEGMQWDFDRDSLDGDMTRVAALGALTFFLPGDIELRIPASFYRSFITGKNCSRRAVSVVPSNIAKIIKVP